MNDRAIVNSFTKRILGIARDEDDLEVGVGLSDFLDQTWPVDAWHHDICNQEIDFVCVIAQQFERVLAVLRLDNVVSLVAQRAGAELTHGPFVLDQEHRADACKISRPRGLGFHGYRYTAHEARAGEIARETGFTQVSVSHVVSPLMKMVSRGDTTVVDAYLSPILRRYVDRVAAAFEGDAAGKLMFMQSSGGLTDARMFQGKDAILSGPAGGVVGCVRTSEIAGFEKIIGFDMGGTSTDVCHYAGEYERVLLTQVAGRAGCVPR